MCPANDGKTCIDADGIRYGVLCGYRFSGNVITNFGRKKFLLDRDNGGGKNMRRRMLEERDYVGTFEYCSEFCDVYSDLSAYCMGVGYHGGYCMAYDNITGTFPQVGGIAAVRQAG
jgi:hypothetical protein